MFSMKRIESCSSLSVIPNKTALCAMILFFSVLGRGNAFSRLARPSTTAATTTIPSRRRLYVPSRKGNDLAIIQQMQHQMPKTCSCSFISKETIALAAAGDEIGSGDESSPSDDDNQDEKLMKLGYSKAEINRSRPREPTKEDIKVRVDLVDNVDPFTLTAVGFALIAINFFVFANVGDGGIGGIVATIMNLSNQ